MYSRFCFNALDEVFDIRNGLLLRADLKRLFDRYLFTIKFLAGQYQVVVSELDLHVSAELQNYNEKVICFYGNESQWPAPEFLEHHNAHFNFRQKKLEAEAEPIAMKKSKSGNTIIYDNIEENANLSKYADDIWEEQQKTLTFLNLE